MLVRDRAEVEVIVTSKNPADVSRPLFARCLDGKRAGPPEDCGGPFGYAELVAALADPKHEEHEARKEWFGEFDAEKFNLAAINKALAKRFKVRGRRAAH